jgi:hypothetical protein
MANNNAPSGFKPIKSLSGSTIQMNYYKVASSASRIGKGDLVKLSSGNLVRESSSVAVGPWVGVAMIDSGTIAAGGIAAFPVCDDPNTIFEVQGSTAALAVANFGTIVKADCHTAPDTNTGISKNVLTNTTATATNGVRIIRAVNRSDNVLGASAVLEVVLNADIYNGNLS